LKHPKLVFPLTARNSNRIEDDQLFIHHDIPFGSCIYRTDLVNSRRNYMEIKAKYFKAMECSIFNEIFEKCQQGGLNFF